MEYKKIKYILPAEKIDMGGFPVKQALPTQKVSQVDPFLLVHHGRAKYSDRKLAKHQGIGPHPHKGFSPVTFVVEGEVHHRDSRGNNQVAKSGEVQWMHAGAGIIHSERPSVHITTTREYQEIIQIWVNSPEISKSKIPKYTYLPAADMPIIISEDQQIKTKVVSGTFNEASGKIIGESPLHILWVNGEADGSETFEIPKDFNSCLYLIKGSIRVTGLGLLEKENLLVFKSEASMIGVEVLEQSQFLILSGLPIGEKVVQSGPYVMNSETEILRAMRDYQMGKMGILIEE